ncbi:MAG: hypothetical protein MK105_00895 [Crocinitomicaceae bacterium]|nr:hypothetical protein [Crocinitomicaceae bacterium]
MKKYIALALFAISIVSCKKNKTVWDTDWSSPLINDTLSLENLVNDSTISEVGGFYELDLNRTLFDLDLGELIEIPDTTISEEFIFSGTLQISGGFNFVNSVEEHNLDLEEVQLKTIVLKEGFIDVKVQNPLGTTTIFNVELPGVTKDGVTFNNQYSAPPGSNASPGIVEETIDLSGYRMDLTGISGGEFNVLKSKIIVSTALDGPDVIISPADITKVDATFRGVKVDYARGYFGDKVLSDTTVVDLEVLDVVSSGAIDLPNTSIVFKIENGVKVIAEGNLLNVSNENNFGNTVSLDNAQIGSSFNIDPATGTWDALVPSQKNIEFNSSNSNIEEYIENLGNKHEVGYHIQLNPWGNVTGGWDEMFSQSRLKVNLEANMPLTIGVDELVLKDTFNLNFTQNENNTNVKSGEMMIQASNAFPFSADLMAYFLDDDGNILYQINGTNPIESSQFGSIDPASSLMMCYSEMKLVLGEEILDDLSLVKKIIIQSNFNSTNPNSNINEPMSIPVGAYLAVKVKTKFTSENKF